MKFKYLTLILLVVLVFSLISCSKQKEIGGNTETEVTETTQPINNPPFAKIKMLGELEISKVITFDASDSYDKDRDSLICEWTLPDGTKSNEEPVNFTLTKFGKYEVKLIVSDGENISTEVKIFEVVNNPPVAVVNETQVECKVNDVIELSANGSYDNEGDNLTYQWTLPNGEVENTVDITYTPTETGTQNITLTVSDGNQEDSKVITITISESEEDFKKSCQNVKYGELLRNPDKYLFEKIHVKGEIVQYISNMEFHFNITNKGYGFWDDRTWLVLNNPPEENIIEDDVVEVWGYGGGNQEYETVMGRTNIIPVIFAEYVKIIQKAD